jgi:hypothetical protein
MTIPGKLEITEGDGGALGGGGGVTMILNVTIKYYPVDSNVPDTGIL